LAARYGYSRDLSISGVCRGGRLDERPSIIAENALAKCRDRTLALVMPISHSSGSRSVIPIDPDQCGVA
jgi:hypothetical protein